LACVISFLLIIGTVIGSGMFIVPGAVLRQVQGGVSVWGDCNAPE
jgi:hypothetical protein